MFSEQIGILGALKGPFSVFMLSKCVLTGSTVSSKIIIIIIMFYFKRLTGLRAFHTL